MSYLKLEKLFIPKIEKARQKRTVVICNSFAQKLDTEIEYLKILKEQKQYLLSKMFI